MSDNPHKRQTAYRRRKRRRAVLVAVEVEPGHVAALQSLELLAPGPVTKPALAAAVQRFLSCAASIADIPKRLYP